MRASLPRSIYRRLQSSLRARILIPTGVLFAVVLAVMALGAVQIHESDAARHQREKAELFGQVVANGLSSLMLDRRPLRSELNDFLTVVASHRAEIHSISLLRPSGTIAHSSRASLLGTVMHDGPPLTDTPVAFAATTGAEQYTVRRPILNQPSCRSCHAPKQPVIGWLEVRFDRNAIAAEKSRLAGTLTGAAVPALFLLIGVTAYLLRREVIRPLHGLVAAMKRVRAGELTATADSGRPDELGVAARGFDTTVRALREAQVEVESFYRERMLQADRFATVGEMATGLAHEIKNPLAGLSGALELLVEDLRGTAEQREVVLEMQHQVARLTAIMQSLLDFARPPQALLRPVDLNGTLENVLFLVQQQRRSAPIEIRAELAAGLPFTLADPAQLEQVFLNLCLNAMQAIPGGGRLTVRSRATATGVSVEVEDNGPGIAPEIRATVFRPFFTTKRNGSGLGLAISARIVAEHGGHIDFQCPERGGTVFFVHLRAAVAAKEDAA